MKTFLRAASFAALFLAGLAVPGGSQHSPGVDPNRLPANTLPPPELMSGIGQETFRIATSSPEAQRYFNQGLNLLHCFWDFEAYRAFRRATQIDPTAAMAWWGIFQSLQYNPSELGAARAEALQNAQRLARDAPEKERIYVEALTSLTASGATAYVRDMEAIVSRYPDDLQAKLLLAKFLVTDAGGQYTSSDGVGSSFERAKEILRPLLAAHPKSAAVHHYWIHAWELSATPQEALASAEVLPSLAPSAAHIVHMPGHIYFKMGEYDRARAAFLDALRTDRFYMASAGIGAVDNWSYTHNLDYLVANCAEDGRLSEGHRHAAALAAVPAPIERSDSPGLGYVVYGARTAAARLSLRYGRFGDAAAILEEGLATWRFPSQAAANYVGALMAYARVMEAVEEADMDAAAPQLQRLARIASGLTQLEVELKSDWYFGMARRILAVAAVEAGGAVLSSQGRHDEGIGQLLRAVEMEARLGYGEPPHYTRPVRETLARAYLRAGRPDEALQAYREILIDRPQSGHAWLGIARAVLASGDAEGARAGFERFLELWSAADPTLPQVREAKDWLARNP